MGRGKHKGRKRIDLQMIYKHLGDAFTVRKLAENCGYDYLSLYHYAQNHNIIYELLDKNRERIKDLAEETLVENLTHEKHSQKAVEYLLKNQASERGYSDRIQHTINGSMNLVGDLAEEYQKYIEEMKEADVIEVEDESERTSETDNKE